MFTKMNRRARRGQAMVEMALVVTILLFLTLGLIQYGIIANARITQTNIAREGARFAAVHAKDISYTFPTGTCGLTAPRTDTNMDTATKFYMTNCVADYTPLKDLADTNIAIAPAVGDPLRDNGKPIMVTVTYNIRNKFILPVTSFPGLNKFSTTTTSTATMVIE